MAIVQKPRRTPRQKISTGLPVGARVKCTDNTGGKVISILAVVGYKGRKTRTPSASVGDMVVVSVKKGTPQLRRQILTAIIVRQKKPYKRKNGITISFEDNAAVLTTPTGEPKGSEIRGPIAREVAERWPRIAGASSIIV